jgi:16S rRNA processing protein RimM
VRRRPEGKTTVTEREQPRSFKGELLAVGRVTRAHGVRGEVAVQPLSEVEARFRRGSVLLLGPAGDRHLTVRGARMHGRRLLVNFEEVADRADAESLRGQLLFVPAASAPPLPALSYWIHEVVGIEVMTEEGRSLGRVREVLHTMANDIWLVEGAGREVLLPALRDVVVEVDPIAGRAIIRDVPGLMEEDS